MCEQKSYEAKPDSKETPKPTLIDELTAVKKKYEDLAKEAKIKEMQGAKRKPLSDGTLPMTESEKVEIAKMIGFSMVYRIVYASDHLCAYISPYHKPITVDNIKAILWLAERFELTSNN